MGFICLLFGLDPEKVRAFVNRCKFDIIAFGVGLVLFILPFALLWAGQVFRGHPTEAEWQNYGANHGPWVDCWGRYFIGGPLVFYLALLVVYYAFLLPLRRAVSKEEQMGCKAPCTVLGCLFGLLVVQILALIWLVD